MQFYKELQEEFDAIFQFSFDGIFIADGEGNVIRLNKASERIDEVKADEVLGKNMKDLVARGIYSESVTLKVLEEKKPVTILQKTKSGKEVMATGTPIFKNGELYRVVVNCRDITQLNTLKNELRNVQLKSEKYESELKLLRKVNVRTDDIIGNSPQLNKVLTVALRVAGVDTTVLLLGESGVGKEVFSKFIHRNSSRKDGSFIKIDCSGIPENLLESELFGYEKGAFTGANKTGKVGMIELANEGTLFLDEIGELPFSLQAKLLRVFQDREILKIGGTSPIPVNIRIIGATNKDLESMVKQNQFREDLFYRLNVVPIIIPPLRERKEDIQLLISYFLDKFTRKFGLEKVIDPETLGLLLDFNWPGNVRELENMIERLTVTTTNKVIKAEDLPEKIYRSNGKEELLLCNESFRILTDNFEKNLLQQTIKKAKSIQEVAIMLKLDVSTIRRKLNKHKLKNPY
ncbi:MAG: hypothetical protein JM58_04310 [Peptococcaceae bacterium BICA1-8]|nr:MAG: hypothetical protein JM58_04310 [Peptococcaceae bacterium BICA1-8]